jgi:hypothetical protein
MKSEDAVFLKTEQNVFIFIFKRTSLRLSEASQAQWRRQVSEFGGAFEGQTHILGGAR